MEEAPGEGQELEEREVNDGGPTHSMLVTTPRLNKCSMTLPEVSTARIFNLLASSGLQHILQSHGWATNITAGGDEEEEYDDYDDDIYFMPDARRRNRQRSNKEKAPLPKVPSDAGTELMNEGHFGTNQYFVDQLKKRKMAFATHLMWRELGVDSHGVRRRTDQAISQVGRSNQTQQTNEWRLTLELFPANDP